MKRLFTASMLVTFMATFTLTSCSRKDDNKTVDAAGKGGNTTLKVTPQHHGQNIDSCTIYLKYNAKELPSDFDEQTICIMENGKPVATFTGLKKGDYYIYGKGWDPSITQKVVGGIPYTVSEEKTYDINIPVTEGD